MIVVHENIMGHCPGGFCEYLLQFSEVLAVLLLADGFIFLVTLLPPLFTWKNKKPDSKKRVFFAVFACLTFYFWLTILAINSLYCFGFLAYAGPCNASTSSSTSPHQSSNIPNININSALLTSETVLGNILLSRILCKLQPRFLGQSEEGIKESILAFKGQNDFVACFMVNNTLHALERGDEACFWFYAL